MKLGPVSQAPDIRVSPVPLGRAPHRVRALRQTDVCPYKSAAFAPNRQTTVGIVASASASQTSIPPQTQGQAPPPQVRYPVSLEALPVARGVTLLRATCRERLPEIQFGQKLGTTSNCYLVSPNGSDPEVLIDVPSKVYDYDLAAWLVALDALPTLHTIIVTRLNPERIPALKAVLTAAPRRLRLIASNPALQLLKDRATADPELAALLGPFVQSDSSTVPASESSSSSYAEETPSSSAASPHAAGGNNFNKISVEAVGRCGPLVLSTGAELRLIPVPTPRWPDLCAVYYPEERILFSSSFFAAHEAPKEGASAFDEGGWEAHGEAWRFYYDCMLAPSARQTAAALDRLRINAAPARNDLGPLDVVLRPLRGLAQFVTDLTLGADDGRPEPVQVGILCPIHGPAVRTSLTQLVRRYVDWTAEQVRAASTASVAVLYASAYGNTAALAQAISRGVTKAGVAVETLNLEVAAAEEVEKALESASGFVIGSPTLGGHMPTQVQTALGAILRSIEAKSLPCGVFGSFGWSGEAVDMMESRLKDAGFRFAFPAIRCKFTPTEAMLQRCEESGTDLAQVIRKELLKKERATAKKLAVAETASAAALALGRVVGSLCILTARDGDASSAMLASWVSQASFDPPGVTIAVKKDRAVEALLPVGNRFVLNVLAEGKDKSIMKAMLKPFGPGEDRFAGLQVESSEGTGAVIFPEAAAYLECTVAQRMETGDHWLVYATVDSGRVLNDDAQSAVHFRSVGTTY